MKFTEDRREHFISSAHERGQVHHIEVGFDDDGRLLGLDVEFWHDHGAYSPYGLIVPIITSTQLLGPYKPQNYRVVFESMFTNTVMVTPYRGAGRPQGCYAMERTMDAIAAYLGKDRADVRSANFIQPDEFPYDQGLIFQDGRELEYDSGDYPASLDKLKKLVGWDEFPAFQEEMAAQGRRVGIGLACYVEGTGVGPYEGAHVHIETSGKVKVATGLTTQGQGHATVFAQLVADELGVKFEDVEVVTGDTRRMPYAVGTFASRAAVMSGSAIHLAAKRAKEKVLRIAAEALEADEADLEIVDGVVSVKGSPGSSIDLGTVSVLSNPLRYAFDEASKAATQFSVGDPGKPPVAEDDEPGLEGKDFYSPERATFASGMHAVIVETDPDTAEIKILKYAVVHDCGHLINPMIVEGQIHGGVAQGVGGALYERMAYDESGQLLNASFMDFLMPYVSEIPDGIDIDHLETPVAAQPARDQGRRRGRRDPVGGRVRGRHRGRRGHPDPGDADLAVRAVPPRRQSEGVLMKIAGANTVPFPVDKVWDALLDPQVLVATIPGCERLETTGEHTYAMTVTAGVAAIKGTYAGTCALSDLKEHESLVMKLQGAGAPGHRRRDRGRALRAGRRRRHPDRLRGRRHRRRHGRRRRPADARVGVEADGGGVLRQRRQVAERRAPGCSVPPRVARRRSAVCRGPARRLHRARRRPAASPPRTTSSRASSSAPAWCSPV